MKLNRPAERGQTWWKESVVYQIYPRSFNDSNGDGIGDIPGIIEKVDYLEELGVDVVWLCPVYDSPNEDNGYDIRDFRSIMDEFGTMAHWEELLEELHARDIRLIMDLVMNHTSNEHEWFQRSRREEGEYAEYYYWRDGKPAGEVEYGATDGPAGEAPPNNWESIFGGPAWSYDERRGQWYLHLFHPGQPDLNWRNPAVRAAMKETITWWLEKDIDGFRVDAIDLLSKPEGLPDGDPSSDPTGVELYSHGPRLGEYLREVYEETFSNYDVMTVGEMGMATIEQTAEFVGEDGAGLDMVFQFDHLSVDAGDSGPWALEEPSGWELCRLKEIITDKQQTVEWDALFLGNHDLPRIVSRLGDDGEYREESAKLIATFLLTMRGTPFIYQGEEIGMTNADFHSLDEMDDPQTLGKLEGLFESGAVDSFDDVREIVNHRSRDHARTPMQWSDADNAAFTSGTPWMKLNENYEAVNVAASMNREDSVWHYYRQLIELRNEEDLLVYGQYDLLSPDDDHIFAYRRTDGDEQLLVVLNWSGKTALFAAPEVHSFSTDEIELLVGNYSEPPDDPRGRLFRPYEAAVYRLSD